MKTDTELKMALAKMLPEKVFIGLDEMLCWHEYNEQLAYPVSDTELLHVCWLVEETLNDNEQIDYTNIIYKLQSTSTTRRWCVHPDCHATWQQRCAALCKVRGID